MIKIIPNYIISGREVKSSEFRDIIKKYIVYLTNSSRDKGLLDEQATDQIIDLTYKYNTSLNATFFSNNLMPKDLYDKLKFITWRLHSSEKATFLIELPDNVNTIKISTFLDLFFPQLFVLRKKITRKEKVKSSEEKKKEISILEEEEAPEEENELDDVGDLSSAEEFDELDEFSLLEEIDVSSHKIEPPQNYKEKDEEIIEKQEEIGKLGPYEFEYNEEKYTVDDPITGPLRYIKLKLDIDIEISKLNNPDEILKETIIINEKIKEKTTLIKEYGDYNLKLDTTGENVLIKVEAKKIESSEAIKELLGNKRIFQIGFTLKNIKKSGKSSQRRTIFKKSLICPLIKLIINNGILIKHIQKLEDLIETLSWNKEEKDLFYDKQKLINLFSRQVNSILTFKEEDSLCISPFGIFDQLRYTYEEIDMDDIFDDINKFKQKLYNDGDFTPDEIKLLERNNEMFYNISYIKIIHLIFSAIKSYLKSPLPSANPKLRSFQWLNTLWRIKYLLKKLKYKEQIDNEFTKFQNKIIDRATLKKNLTVLSSNYESIARIIKAPTGSGKTLIFFIDSLLHYFFTKERCVIIFPTRLLNLEMFQNLTTIIYLLNQELKKVYSDSENLTAGLYIGQFQYNLRSSSAGSNDFTLIPTCPECRSNLTFKINRNNVPECKKCHHLLDYIYTPYKYQINYFIADFLVATPDKIFWDLFIDWRVASRYGNFGTLVIKCPSCKKYTSFLNKIQNIELNENQTHVTCLDTACQYQIPLIPINIERKLIGFIILDEIHSVSGLTGIFLSKLLKSLKFAQKKYLGLKDGYKFDIEVETGTATIAEEESFISKLVEKRPSPFPKDKEYNYHFILKRNEVRYRILILNTVFSALRRVFTYANLYSFKHYFIDKDYNHLINALGYPLDLLNLGCAYVYRKDDGYSTKSSIIQFSKNVVSSRTILNYLNQAKLFFISGNSEQREIIKFLKEVEDNKIPLFIANQVVSLGLNIKGLNRIILFGTPKSMNEQVQTIGRIGRAEMPGFATILLYPNVPRDDYLYENFHFYFLNCNKLFEPNPIQNFNLFVTEVLTPNLFLLFIYTELEKNYLLKQQRWSNKFWLTSTPENQRIITNFILNILSGTNIKGLDEEFTNVHKEEIFFKIREVLRIIESVIKRAGANEFLNQILDRNSLLVNSLRKDSGQVAINIIDTNTNFKIY